MNLKYLFAVIFFTSIVAYSAEEMLPKTAGYCAMTVSISDKNTIERIIEACTPLMKHVAEQKQRNGSSDTKKWEYWSSYRPKTMMNQYEKRNIEDLNKEIHISLFQSYKKDVFSNLKKLGFQFCELSPEKTQSIINSLTLALQRMKSIKCDKVFLEQGSIRFFLDEFSRMRLQNIFNIYKFYFNFSLEGEHIPQMEIEKNDLILAIQSGQLKKYLDNLICLSKENWSDFHVKIYNVMRFFFDDRSYYEKMPIIREQLKKTLYSEALDLFTSLFSREAFLPHLTLSECSNIKTTQYELMLEMPIVFHFDHLVLKRNETQHHLSPLFKIAPLIRERENDNAENEHQEVRKHHLKNSRSRSPRAFSEIRVNDFIVSES